MNRRYRRRKRISAIAQRSLPLYMPARPREEYRLCDLIERLNLALDTWIDRAVVEEAAAYLNELYLATTEESATADISRETSEGESDEQDEIQLPVEAESHGRRRVGADQSRRQR